MKRYKQFMVVCIGACIVLVVLMQGCGTTNGMCRDVKWVAERGIDLTQDAVDGQRDSGIAFAIGEQNRIILRGQNMQLLVTNK